MKSLPAIAALVLSTFALSALAPAAAHADELQPFVATYQVFNDGSELGDATLQLVPMEGQRWRIDLGMKGRGLMRLTGLNVQQSTIFDSNGDGSECVDLDECRGGTFKCDAEATCLNTAGSYDCLCNPGSEGAGPGLCTTWSEAHC